MLKHSNKSLPKESMLFCPKPFFSTSTGRAFSLVELSIVLVILGLLVGGTLAGKSLIHASELRSVTTQLDSFITADRTFREKYSYLAGDMPNATQYWGQVPGSVLICARTQGTGTETCDGNGNGYVDAQGNGSYNEQPRYWQHLSNAGLIGGSFSGVGATAAVCCYVTVTNAPLGKLPNSAWFPYSDDGFGFTPTPFNYMFGGLKPAGSAGTPSNSLFTPEEIWNIDTKIDNGQPRTGRVQSWAGSLPNNCVTGPAATDTYILTYTDVACFAQFYTQ